MGANGDAENLIGLVRDSSAHRPGATRHDDSHQTSPDSLTPSTRTGRHPPGPTDSG